MSETVLDSIVIIVMLFFALLGVRRGLIHNLVSVIAWIGGAIAALWGFQPLGEWLFSYISPSWFAYTIAAFGIFIVVFSVVLSIGHGVSEIMRQRSIGILDRGLGLLFGLAQGLVLVVFFYICFLWLTPEDERDWVRQARLFPVVESVHLLLWKGMIAISSVEEIWPDLRFDPSTLPGLSPEQPLDGPEQPDNEEKSGYNKSNRGKIAHFVQVARGQES